MVYLNNDTNQQEVWIERNDGLGAIHTGTSGSYQEGFNDGKEYQKSLLSTTAFTENGEYERENGWSGVTVDVPQTGHTDQELEDAYESGYTSGQTDQKNLLTTTAFTENGSYQRENGWSGVTVNIDTASTYNSGWTDGYDSGYTSGETHQKNLLTTTAFTENGNYTRENGWSGVSVNVDTASTYNSGYTSGHTDGANEEKAKLSATTITANTAVTVSDGGYSAITVNVPQTGTSAQLEEKSVTISADTTYIVPTPGYDGMSAVTVDASEYAQENYDSGFEDGFEDGYSSGSTDEKAKLSGITLTANTAVTLSDGGYSAVTVNVPQTGSSIPLSSITLTANTAISVSDKAYTGITVNVDTASTYNSGYTDGENAIIDTFSAMTATTNGVYGSSAHPLSSITVDVTTTASDVTYVEYLETDGSEISWDTGVKLTDLDEVVYFDFAPLTGTPTGDAFFAFLSQQQNDFYWALAIRTNVVYRFDSVITQFGNKSQNINYTEGVKNTCILSKTGATVNGVDYQTSSSSVSTTSWNIIINGQKNNDSPVFMRFPVARYYGFKIMSGETAVICLKPALDGNNVPCFYDEVSGTYIYHTGSGTPIAGPIVHYSDYMSGFTDGYASGFTDGYNSGLTDGYASGYTDGYASGLTDGYASGFTDGYASGYTDGYNSGYTSGYTDGQNNIIGTFSSMTATTNGVYGSSANPLSSITVDVQTENYGELIGLYCTNNCQFVLGHGQYLEDTSISFGIRTGNVSINVGSSDTAPSVNRIEVDSNGNVTGYSYSYSIKTGSYSTGSGQTSVVLNAFPTENFMVIETGVKNTARVNNSSASTCMFYQSTPANGLLLSIDDGYFYGEYINNPGSDLQSCIFPHVDADGNACIIGDSNLFYPISGECYPIYKNGNNYYVLMKTQPWNQQ